MKTRTPEQKSAYDQEYIRKNVKRKLIAFNMTKERDRNLWNWLESQPEMTQYIKNLIEQDMNR